MATYGNLCGGESHDVGCIRSRVGASGVEAGVFGGWM